MVRATRHCANSATPVLVLALVLLGSVPYIQFVMYSRAIRAELEAKVERLEREHVADSRRMRQMEDAAVKAQSRLKTSEREAAEQAQRYQALEQLLQSLQLKEGVCEGSRKALTDELDTVTKKLETVYKMEVQLKQRTKERDKAQDDNSALEAEVARLKAGMSQALTEARSQLQATQDQLVLETQKVTTYREKLAAQEGATQAARARAQRYASRHAATLEALNARARQVGSLRSDLHKLLQGQDTAIVLGILKRAGVDPEEEEVEYVEDTDQESLLQGDGLEMKNAAGREDPHDATLEYVEEEDDQPPNDPLMVQMGPPWSDSHKNSLQSPRPGGIHKEETPVLRASNNQQPGDGEMGAEEDEEDTEYEIASKRDEVEAALVPNPLSQHLVGSSETEEGGGEEEEEEELGAEKDQASNRAMGQETVDGHAYKSQGQQTTAVDSTWADQEVVADSVEHLQQVDAVSGVNELATAHRRAHDDKQTLEDLTLPIGDRLLSPIPPASEKQTASNADSLEAHGGVDGSQVDGNTDPTLHEDGIASVEKVRAQWRKRMKKLSNREKPLTATGGSEHAVGGNDLMVQAQVHAEGSSASS